MTDTISPVVKAIRVAATRRLCLELGYNGTTRIVEPYSLQATKDGSLLLKARRRDTDELRTYRVDRIQHARLTDIRFAPVYNIEMTAGGPLLVNPPLANRYQNSPAGAGL